MHKEESGRAAALEDGGRMSSASSAQTLDRPRDDALRVERSNIVVLEAAAVLAARCTLCCWCSSAWMRLIEIVFCPHLPGDVRYSAAQ